VTANEPRAEIMRILSGRRFETMSNLAFHFMFIARQISKISKPSRLTIRLKLLEEMVAAFVL